MKYYTETIPVSLAEKLKEKGMPLGNYVWIPNGMASSKEEANLAYYDDQLVPYCNYAEVFDWLLDKHEAFVYVTCLRMDEGWQYCGGIWGYGIDMTFGWQTSWHEAANAAIEKALELIK